MLWIAHHCFVRNTPFLYCSVHIIIAKNGMGCPVEIMIGGMGRPRPTWTTINTISKRVSTHPPQSRFTPHNLSVEGQEARTRYNLLLSKQVITKTMMLNLSFCSATANHNTKKLQRLPDPCHRCRQKVRKIWRNRNLTVPKPPLASTVRWVIFQWFKEFGRGGIMWNKTFVHNYMETWNPCPHH